MVVISGQVQGVSFRASMKFVAERYGVEGWVRNREDGAVEALVRGEESAVEKLLEWAGRGPPGAHVVSLEKHKVSDSSAHRGFQIVA